MPRSRTRNKTVLNMGVTAGIRTSGGRPPAPSGRKRGRKSGDHAGDAASGQLPTASAELLPPSASSAASEVSGAGDTEVPLVVLPSADTAYGSLNGLTGGSAGGLTGRLTGALTGHLPSLPLAQEEATPMYLVSAAAGTPALQPQGGDSCVGAAAAGHNPHLEQSNTPAAPARKLTMVTCPICNRELPEESISRHVDTCLRQKSSQDSRAQREKPLRADKGPSHLPPPSFPSWLHTPPPHSSQSLLLVHSN